ncbi:MAG TPA: transporter substrate-binding domain-containing protein [Chitinimonas sp.]
MAVLSMLTCANAAERLVHYPNVNGLGSEGLGYKALALALKKSGQPYRLVLHDEVANIDRTRAMLEQGQVDVVDFGTSPDFESRYGAVYFPIDRGLNGWRLLLIRAQDVPRFRGISSLTALKAYTAGQGQNWADIAILRAAGLTVNTMPTLPDLFPTLAAQRFDFVPLGVNEIYGLLEKYRPGKQDLVVDEHLVLVYPFGRLFFVRKDDTDLRDALLRGLTAAFDDGSYQRMLEADPAYAEALHQANLGQRVRLLLDNPAQTAAFRAIPRRYFLH